jgi:mRNA-degrading endonuclease RelE of RelBE toxin-antitoxin system
VIYTQPDPRFQEEVKKQISDMDKKHQELMQAMLAQMQDTNVKREREV